MRLGGRPLDDVADPAKVAARFAEGATLVLQGLHRYWLPLTRFCRSLERVLGHAVQANAYVTPAGAQGLGLHADDHDVFTLQVLGRKSWQAYAPGRGAGGGAAAGDRHRGGPRGHDVPAPGGAALGPHDGVAVDPPDHRRAGHVVVVGARRRAGGPAAEGLGAGGAAAVRVVGRRGRLRGGGGRVAGRLGAAVAAAAADPAAVAAAVRATAPDRRPPLAGGSFASVVRLDELDDSTVLRRAGGGGGRGRAGPRATRWRSCWPTGRCACPAEVEPVLRRVVARPRCAGRDLGDELDEAAGGCCCGAWCGRASSRSSSDDPRPGAPTRRGPGARRCSARRRWCGGGCWSSRRGRGATTRWPTASCRRRWRDRCWRAARAAGVRVLLVRRPGRSRPSTRRLLLADSGPDAPWLRQASVEDVGDLARLDLGAVFAAGGEGFGRPAPGPTFLVCTHGRHDPCCADLGRPLVRALKAAGVPRVWESSHLGGDRFAGNLLCLPHGLYFGQVAPEDGAAGGGRLPGGRDRARAVPGAVVLPHGRAGGRDPGPSGARAPGASTTWCPVPAGRRRLGPGDDEVALRAADGRTWSARVRTAPATTPRLLTCRGAAESTPPSTTWSP